MGVGPGRAGRFRPAGRGSDGLCVFLSEGIGEGAEQEDCVQALSGQIFMGMVSSQFQAKLDTVRLIDALVTACIRFVYFSMEDELRSKVSRHLGGSVGRNVKALSSRIVPAMVAVCQVDLFC